MVLAPWLFVVIPCRDEVGTVATLDSLWHALRPEVGVEVLLVVNGSADDDSPTRQRGVQQLETLRAWCRDHEADRLVFSLRDHPDLPPREAGVGLARKIGMDEAGQRLLASHGPAGVIAALDADCLVDTHYLTQLTHHFQTHPHTQGASIYFEHPLENLTARHRCGIVYYELFLRYYRWGVVHTGSPHHFHTVGSSMVVRAEAYRRLGGMNRRKAGEDFYFLQKVMAHGPFSEILDTTVFPSPRISNRVPFGTGRAMKQWHEDDQEQWMTSHPQGFRDLALFFAKRGALSSSDGWDGASEVLREFLQQQNFARALHEIRRHTATAQAFEKRFFLWFNPFRIMKFIHFATDRAYGRLPITQAAKILLDHLGMTFPGDEAEPLLHFFRDLDRHARWKKNH